VHNANKQWMPVAQNLKTAEQEFCKVETVGTQMEETYYLQARIFHELGNLSQRNEASKKFKEAIERRNKNFFRRDVGEVFHLTEDTIQSELYRSF
jgi:hypothetical protein